MTPAAEISTNRSSISGVARMAALALESSMDSGMYHTIDNRALTLSSTIAS
jgi:hypothetical protein